MNKKEIDELLQHNLNLKHENAELKEDIKKLIEQNETLKIQLMQDYSMREIDELKSEKEFLMLTITALTKLTNNLIK